MDFWSVLYFVSRSLTRRLTPAPPALSVLPSVLHELLGHRLPLPHVHWLVWYALSSPQTDGD